MKSIRFNYVKIIFTKFIVISQPHRLSLKTFFYLGRLFLTIFSLGREKSFKNFVQRNYTIFVGEKVRFDEIIKFLIFLLHHIPLGRQLELEIRIGI